MCVCEVVCACGMYDMCVGAIYVWRVFCVEWYVYMRVCTCRVCVCVLRRKVERGDVALPSVELSLPLALFPAS